MTQHFCALTGQVYSGFYWYWSTGNIETDVKRLLRGPLLKEAERNEY